MTPEGFPIMGRRFPIEVRRMGTTPEGFPIEVRRMGMTPEGFPIEVRRMGTTPEGFPIMGRCFPIEVRRMGTTPEGLLDVRRRPETRSEGFFNVRNGSCRSRSRERGARSSGQAQQRRCATLCDVGNLGWQ